MLPGELGRADASLPRLQHPVPSDCRRAVLWVHCRLIHPAQIKSARDTV